MINGELVVDNFASGNRTIEISVRSEEMEDDKNASTAD